MQLEVDSIVERGSVRVGTNQNYLADIAVVDLALCLGVGLVKAAHEAKLEDQVGMCFG